MKRGMYTILKEKTCPGSFCCCCCSKVYVVESSGVNRRTLPTTFCLAGKCFS